MRVKKKILFTINGKKFSSLDETNLILQDAEWIHPDLKNACQVTDKEFEWMDAIARERDFQKAVDRAQAGKTLTKKQIKLINDC